MTGLNTALNTALAVLLASAMAVGCTLDSSGGGGDTDTDTEGDTDSASTNVSMSATNPSSTSPSSTDSDPTETTDDSSSSSGDTESTTDPTSGSDSGSETSDTDTSADDCRPFQRFIWTSELPARASTFNESMANSLPPVDGLPVMFLWGQEAGMGFTTFSFDTPCDDDVYVWVLGWDAEGNDPSNSDSFYFGLDEEAVTIDSDVWEYGCDNSFRGRGWQWYPVRITGDECGDDDPISYALDEGDHEFTVVPRETASFDPINFNFGGLAAFVATNDPDYDPRDDYDPSPPE